MKTSDTTAAIGAALAKVGAKMKNPAAEAENPFFHSKYAALPDILNMARPILAKEGVSVIQSCGQAEDGNPTISTLLLHESGEWIETDALALNPTKQDPQGVGSAITYGRRYSLCAALGIASEEDDDGNSASQPTQRGRGEPRRDTQEGDQPPVVGCYPVVVADCKERKKGTLWVAELRVTDGPFKNRVEPVFLSREGKGVGPSVGKASELVGRKLKTDDYYALTPADLVGCEAWAEFVNDKWAVKAVYHSEPNADESFDQIEF